MSEKTFEGIPRNKIFWDPIIDYEKCIACGKCVDFCHAGAFKFKENDGEKQPVVKTNRCIVFCKGCEDICPAGAITHPPEKETKKSIEELKKQ